MQPALYGTSGEAAHSRAHDEVPQPTVARGLAKLAGAIVVSERLCEWRSVGWDAGPGERGLESASVSVRSAYATFWAAAFNTEPDNLGFEPHALFLAACGRGSAMCTG